MVSSLTAGPSPLIAVCTERIRFPLSCKIKLLLHFVGVAAAKSREAARRIPLSIAESLIAFGNQIVANGFVNAAGYVESFAVE